MALTIADQSLLRDGLPSGDVELELRKGNGLPYRTVLRRQDARLITQGQTCQREAAGLQCQPTKDPLAFGAQAEWTWKGLNLDPASLTTLALRSSTPLPLQQIKVTFNNRFLVLHQVGTPALPPTRSSGAWLWEAPLGPMGLGKVASLDWVGAHQLRWSPVEGAADYTVRASDGRGQLRFQETVKGTHVFLPATLRCDEAGLSVSDSAHSDQRVPGPPTYKGACSVGQGQ